MHVHFVSCFYLFAEQSHPKPGQGSQTNIRNERGTCNTSIWFHALTVDIVCTCMLNSVCG